MAIKHLPKILIARKNKAEVNHCDLKRRVSIKIIYGLGNPGSAFVKSRHSLGKLMVSMYADSMAFPKNWPSTKENLTLVLSTSYMNDSGKQLKKISNDFVRKVSPLDKIVYVVVHDELELDLGKVKLRLPGGSHRGHNGIRSCQEFLGKESFYRIGLGIGRCESRNREDVSDYVLSKFNSNEMKLIETDIFHKFCNILQQLQLSIET
ncbi:mitochondrial peptidyl-tRNA hydrolase Pth1 [Schizosaccharomyces pombe]|uniref:Probable peptidyl-tRNA hydrolase n=1 Tax=Schizosaccharomyces pombe (strain 972 / ATCC 24843) TaxID=284812 RepID=PTH_SCHPO|nr:putative peptidyl-tRNA hydrolase Pth1 [Schizosaccharomyces pombe]O74806.2 RecName: Full=Probable peptidyl-tRNA hydrolase; Short=PTH [Schizosaccharomyces pombe 972h-]CAA21173.2 mitochondrial peptidyl-tRNA hydrolase Pth1 (predicted) [Schizosaccharomyces pombe]|eukprot:NP_596234.2 putative peptidyl-tRNA hydrolase Pth1 [Schizosaccharomyces pombe]